MTTDTPLTPEKTIHDFFGLSYANYLVLPRSVLQSMSDVWQHQFVQLLEQAGESFGHLYGSCEYKVRLRSESGAGYTHDPLASYDRGRRVLEPKVVAAGLPIAANQPQIRKGIYVASRASIPARGEMWRKLRSESWPIISSWIDEDGPGQTASYCVLWTRIEEEIRRAEKLILYVEAGDFPLKGALIEVGMALAMGVPVYVVAPGVEIDPRDCKPLGSWAQHPLVGFCSMEVALTATSKSPKKLNILTEEDVRVWASRQGIVLADHEVEDISEYSSCDPLEGVEWLPFYKASCLQLVQLVGILSKHVAEGLRPDKAMVNSWKRCWRLSLALSGCGASTDPDALKRSQSMIRENKAFDWADYMKDGGVS